jgi:hypothetical protein
MKGGIITLFDRREVYNGIAVSDIIPLIGADSAKPNRRVLALAEEMITLGISLANPKAWCKVYPLQEVSELLPEIFRFPGVDLVSACACTIGSDLEEQSSSFFSHGEEVKGFILDAVGTALIMNLAAAVYRNTKEEAAFRNMISSPMLLPGEIGIPMELQKMVLAVLSSEDLPVTLSDSTMLRPLKSLSFLCLQGVNLELPDELSPCISCTRRDCTRCAYRRM